MEAVAHNPPALKQQRDRAQKAFSLIEAAFVLAVVGAVIGTIWVSAAKFYEDYKVSKTVKDIFVIAHNADQLIGCRNAIILGGGTEITEALKSAGAFPSDIKDYGSNLFRNPINPAFGGRVKIYTPTSQSCNFTISIFGTILRSVENPKILWIDDAEVIGDGFAESGPFSGDIFAQEGEKGRGELFEGRVALVVGDVLVRQAP